MVIVLLFDMDDDRAIGLLCFINNLEFCVLAFKLYFVVFQLVFYGFYRSSITEVIF